MAFEAIRLTVNKGVGQLVFSDPNRGNPIDGRLCAELREVANLLSERRDLRALLVTAEGKHFRAFFDQ